MCVLEPSWGGELEWGLGVGLEYPFPQDGSLLLVRTEPPRTLWQRCDGGVGPQTGPKWPLMAKQRQWAPLVMASRHPACTEEAPKPLRQAF